MQDKTFATDRKKCQFKDSADLNNSVANGLRDAAASNKSLDTDQADLGRQRLQLEILSQLQKVSQRLEKVEDQVAATSQQESQVATESPSGHGKLSTNSVLVTSNKSSKKSRKVRSTESSSESSDSDTPSLKTLRSYELKRKVDQRIRELNHSSHLSCNAKHKSKRGETLRFL